MAEASSMQSKLVNNFKSKVFTRFTLEGQNTSLVSLDGLSKRQVSLQEIIMESWTGSRVYKLT